MNVAFIPVRGGSKSIPLKNIKEIAGKPLVYWTAKAANECNWIDLVYVATDSVQIREIVESFGFRKVKVIDRDEATASDTATTESAMLAFAGKYHFDNIVLIQATSPLLTSKDLEGGFRLFDVEDTDSVLSVVRQKRFQWKVDEYGVASPINYDYKHRPRRQEFGGYFVENGAFYITSRQALLAGENRLFGNIRAYEMDESTYFEIDEPSDWQIIEEQLLRRELKRRGRSNLSNIKMLLTDCDGCLTDGGMYYTENGDEIKKFNTRDGVGFALLKQHGILTGIVTGENRELNERRAGKLKLDVLEQGCVDKLSVVTEVARRYQLDLNEIAYIGDDINDLDVLKNVGCGICPKDAADEVKSVSSYICSVKGGQGVIRESAEQILKGRRNVCL